jgi:hypothetical protein
VTTVTRGITVLLMAMVGLTGCSSGQGTAPKSEQCSGLVGDLVGSGLAGTPTQEQARTVGLRLDQRLLVVRDRAVHEAAVDLHSRVHGIEDAWKRNEADHARTLAERARSDVGAIAAACDMDASDILARA